MKKKNFLSLIFVMHATRWGGTQRQPVMKDHGCFPFGDSKIVSSRFECPMNMNYGVGVPMTSYIIHCHFQL